MPMMSSEDFSLHREDCTAVGDGMPISDLPDEVNSIDDLDCNCWDDLNSIAELTSA